MTSDILTNAANGLGHITLNRPAALHALTTHMCANMIQALLAWRDDPSIHAILLDHAPGQLGEALRMRRCGQAKQREKEKEAVERH